MTNFNFSEYQNALTKQFESVKVLGEQAVKLNTQFLEESLSQQAQLVADLTETSIQYVRGLTDVSAVLESSEGPVEKFLKDGEEYFSVLKETLTASFDTSVERAKAYQKNAQELMTGFPKSKPASKKTSKSAAK